LLLSSAFGLTHVIYPKSALAEDGSVTYMGRIGLGHVLKIIIDAEYPEKIISISTDPETNIVLSSGRFYIYYTPTDLGPTGIKFFVDKNKTYETFTLSFDVVKSALEVNCSDTVTVPEFSRGSISVVVFNRSLGATDIKITCPVCETVMLPLAPLEAASVDVPLSTNLSGRYRISLLVEDLRAGERYTQNFTLFSAPTLLGRIRAGATFFDFLFPLLQPFKDMAGVVFWRT